MEQYTVHTNGDKMEVEHHDRIEKQVTIEALPAELKLEAGVLLNVDGAAGTSLRLAENGHVSQKNPENLSFLYGKGLFCINTRNTLV